MNSSQMRASSLPPSDSLVLPPDGERKNLNSELWHACAGPLVSLPAVGTRVVYLPQGHIEQVAASTRKVIDTQIPAYPNLPPQLVCQLHDVILHADMETDEVYCQMTLQPVVGQDRESFFSPDVASQSRQPNIFFCKTLTASDTSTHGGFSIPRRAAEKVFPPLDFTQQPPAQELNARDLHDTEWKFRHIYRGQPKRHLLTTGWSVFVSAKRLVAGDSVLFIRNDKGQLLLGIRRAARPQTVMPSSVLSSDSMHIGVLAAAAHAANTNSRFTVFYNPRASPSEFVISYSKFEKAVYHTRVSVGMRFRMLFETEESGMRRYMGTITGISDLDPVRWPNSQWRSIKVGWDESTAGERQRRVSLWEIEPLTTFLVYPPTSNWRLRPSWPDTFGSPFSSDMDFETLKKPSMWMEFQNGSLGYHGLAGTPTMGMNAVLSSFQRSSGVESAVYDALGAAALQEIFPSKQLLFQQQQQIGPPGGIQTQSQQQMQYAVLPQYQQLMQQQQQQPLPLLQQQPPVLQQQPQQQQLLQQHQPQQQSLHQPQQDQLPQHSHQQVFQKLHQQQPPQLQPLHQMNQQQPSQQPQLLYQTQQRLPQDQQSLLHQTQQHHHLSHKPPQQQQVTHQSHQQLGQQHHQEPPLPLQEQQQNELPYQHTSHFLNQPQLHVPQSLSSTPQIHHQYPQQQQQPKQNEQLHEQQAQHQRPNPPQPPLPITHSLSSPSFYTTVSVQQPQSNGLLLQHAQQQVRASQQLPTQKQQQFLHFFQQSQPQAFGSEQLHQQQSCSVLNVGTAPAHVPSSQPQALLSNSVSPPHPTSTDSSSVSSSVTASQHPMHSIFGGSAPDSCSMHPNMASTAQSLMQPTAMAYSDIHQDAAVPASWIAAMSQLSSGLPLEPMDHTRSAENTCDTDSVVLPNFQASGLPSNLSSYRISSQDDLQSDLQRQTLFGVNIDLQSMVMATSTSLGGGMRSDDGGNDLHSQYMSQMQSPLLEMDLPLGSIMFNGGIDDPQLLQAVAQANPPVRTYTKVYKAGSVGRSIDVMRFGNYDELRCEIARLFGLEGQLERPQLGWQLIFADKENDWLLLGDDPWEVFINNVRYIKILSPSEVYDGIRLPPVHQQRQTSSSTEDAVIQQDSRNPSSVITSLEY